MAKLTRGWRIDCKHVLVHVLSGVRCHVARGRKEKLFAECEWDLCRMLMKGRIKKGVWMMEEWKCSEERRCEVN